MQSTCKKFYPIKERSQDLIQRLFKEGKVFQRSVLHENSESGPYCLTYKGLRLGKLELYISPNGSIFLEANYIPDGRYYPVIYETIFDSTSLGRVFGHWTDTNRLAIKTTLKMIIELS